MAFFPTPRHTEQQRGCGMRCGRFCSSYKRLHTVVVGSANLHSEGRQEAIHRRLHCLAERGDASIALQRLHSRSHIHCSRIARWAALRLSVFAASIRDDIVSPEQLEISSTNVSTVLPLELQFCLTKCSAARQCAYCGCDSASPSRSGPRPSGGDENDRSVPRTQGLRVQVGLA